MNYREGQIYQALEQIIKDAGVSIEYMKVHDDSIDGEIWARADFDSQFIMMPDDGDAFPDEAKACQILGHEMGHLMTGLESIDWNPQIREINERTCDLIGAYLYRLAEMTAGYKLEKEAREAWGSRNQ